MVRFLTFIGTLNKSISNFYFGLIILCIAALPVFGLLGKPYITLWDESRLAVNAIEMIINGNWIVTHFEFTPEHWHTKPPLMVWLQVLCMKILGIHETALRLPSAIAGLLTLIYIYQFVHRESQNRYIALSACVLLLSTKGYVGYHVTKTGDTDALLILFTTILVLELYQYAQHLKLKHLIALGLALTGAIMTKGIQGLIFLPAVLGWLLYERKLIPILKTAQFWVIGVISLIPPVFYYYYRNIKDPGYWQIVQENELGGRYLKTLEGHLHPFYHYVSELNFQFLPQLPLLILALIAPVIFKEKISKLTAYLWVVSFFYFVVISSSSTKLAWYVAPVFPLWCIAIALTLGIIYQKILAHFKNHRYYWGFIFLYICGVAGFYAISIYNMFNHRQEYLAHTLHGPNLVRFTHKFPQIKNVSVYSHEYPASILFYLYQINIEQQKKFQLVKFSKENIEKQELQLKINDIISIEDNFLGNYVQQKYELEILHTEGEFKVCKVIRKKI